ncbi:MAG: phage holin family protein [Xanthobacteraceae bacterium]|nr:phage holin family protein [Xanthobacteraceae bacterium]
MALERVKDAALAHAVSDVVSDLADLVQKELRLARAEISDKIATKLQAGIWMSAAGVLALIAILFGLQAVVFGIASYGIAMHWACLIVAGALAAIAGIAFLKGRSDAQEELTPDRTIRQVKRDISTVKEQLT